MATKVRRIKHDLRQMVVSIVAFICNIILLWYITASDGVMQKTVIALGAASMFLSFMLPLIVRAMTYSSIYNVEGFSASYAISEYKLSGWIKGKYLFLDAILNRVNGDKPAAFGCYCRCLKKATDKRLRLACYKDMARYMRDYVEVMSLLLKADEEFPDEEMFSTIISDYYTWNDKADRAEGDSWFEKVLSRGGTDDLRFSMGFRAGKNALLHGEYDKALSILLRTEEYEKRVNPYFQLDIASCCACLGDFDNARSHAVKAAVAVDDDEELDFIKEKLDYIFKAKTNEVNPQTGKLIAELKRRDEAVQADAIKLESLSELVEQE